MKRRLDRDDISQHTALMAERKVGIKKQIQLKLVANQNQKVPEGPVSSWTREQCVDWLKVIGVSYSGAKEDLIKKILKFQKYPSPLEKIRNRAERTTSF